MVNKQNVEAENVGINSMEEPNTIENEKASVMPAEDKEEMYICDIIRAMDFTAKEPQMDISENSRIILC